MLLPDVSAKGFVAAREVPIEVSPALPRGLAASEAARVLAEHGPNAIPHAAGPTIAEIFASQFKSAVVRLLFAACLVSAFLGAWTDAVAIFAIVVLNGFVGFLQEFRAERALVALRSLTAPRARVLRDGHTTVVPAADVVPGDVLVLEAGDIVAADARLLEAHDLSTNETHLTGESLPVEKGLAARAGGTLAERSDTVFLGTSVATGTGVAEVFATGPKTELGKIANLLATPDTDKTPLQTRLERVTRALLFACLSVVGLVAVLGIVHGRPGLETLLTSVSLAVAAVPEGLPAIVTIALAIGVRRMAARNVLVRRLVAVETLGSATVVCTDKTGTLTTGEMAVREVWGADRAAVLDAAAACCDAELDETEQDGTGDPTEVAILREAAREGIARRDIERERPRRSVHPFDGARRRMSVLRSDGVLYVKGAVESVGPLCGETAQAAAAPAIEMASRGLRVLAIAVGREDVEARLRLVGLVGLADPPRSDALDSVRAARNAGLRVVMLTGDHPLTARSIAREVGILGPDDDPDEVVHARVTAPRKLDIVHAWKARGAIVAMTGDGVNDAPALREAHIGIAMGKTGTEVTREASDMVLTDDRFASIVAAVQEGRGVYENVKKTLVYLLSGNAAELLLVLGASILGLAPPLLPVQILWINLVTDGFPALALAMDPAPKELLDRPPRDPGEPILGRPEWTRIGLVGLLEASLALGVFVWGLARHGEAVARDLAFSTLVFCELFRAFGSRSTTRVYFEVGAWTNLVLVCVVAGSVLLQIAVHHIGPLGALLGVGPLSVERGALVLALGLVPVTALEVTKLLRRRLRPSGSNGCAR